MASMVFSALSQAIAARPFASQVGIATCKTAVADMLTQLTVEGKRVEELDTKRSMVFGAFGFAYLGVIQWGIYVRGFRYLFDPKVMDRFCNSPVRAKLKDVQGLRQLGGQIALDFFFIQPAIYFPVYYVFKEAIKGGDDAVQGSPPPAPAAAPADIPDGQGHPLVAAGSVHGESVLAGAMAKYRQNFLVDNFGMCGFWLPMDLVIYSAPIHLRLPLNHGISFLWCCLLSFFRGGDDVVVAGGDKEEAADR